MILADNIINVFTLCIITLWLIRALIIGNIGFCIFMIWNMFLAVSSLLVIMFIENNWEQNIFVTNFLLLTVWLFLLPNAFYILTDLMHLNQDVLVNKKDNNFTPSLKYKRGDALFIFDSFMLFITVFFGSVVGGISLNKFYSLLVTNYYDFRIIMFCSVLLLVGIGVYIGRYGRWNSWDVIIKPKHIILDFLNIFKEKNSLKGLAIVTFTIVLFELFSWLAVVNYSG